MPRYSAAIIVITVYVPGPMSLVALATCAVPFGAQLYFRTGGALERAQTPVAMP